MNAKPIAEGDKRKRLNRVRVLLADRDKRTAGLVHSVLASFGFTNIELTGSGEEALALLRRRTFDLIVTEWNMEPVDGIMLVRAIRSAKDEARMRRDIPIIMLTGRAEKENVQAARDAGITEFIGKPFSAKTLSNRLIQIIDAPRIFVESGGYIGPCRRRREAPPPEGDRRIRTAGKPGIRAKISAPNQNLRQQLGDTSAANILTDAVVNQAQVELLMAEGDFVEWATDSIVRLEEAFTQLAAAPQNKAAQSTLLDIAYLIKSQAGIFGYDLGTEVARLLVQYLGEHPDYRDNDLLVIRKHIDTITVIFHQKIKETNHQVGIVLVDTLRKLIEKFG